jgi:hypothetical protein
MDHHQAEGLTMKYAIYDSKTGRILQTHFEAPVGGRARHLSEQEVLEMLRPDVDRSSVGVAPFNLKAQPGMIYHVDLKTHQVTMAPRPKAAAKP